MYFDVPSISVILTELKHTQLRKQLVSTAGQHKVYHNKFHEINPQMY